MTDKTERDADLIEQIERRLGMGHTAWDTIDPLEIAAAFREALATPAESVNVEAIMEVVESYTGKSSSMARWIRRDLTKLIDSAGGAKGEGATCWSCGASYTSEQRSAADGNCPTCGVEIELPEQDAPQPAEGDGAVAPSTDWPVVIEGEDDNEYVPRRIAEQRVWGALKFEEANRPAATAVVPDAPLKVFDSGPWIYEPDGVRFSGQQLDGAAFAEYRRLLAAAPAAPRGGVVDEAMTQAAFDKFRFHRSHGAGEREAIYAALTAALATKEQRP